MAYNLHVLADADAVAIESAALVECAQADVVFAIQR